MTREGDDVVALLTLQSAHEGAPGAAHGGVVAALFDDLMGISLGIPQIAAFTGELRVRYAAATPIGRPLVCRARVTNVEGRKVSVSAELTDAEGSRTEPYATATSTYISVDRGAFIRPTSNDRG
ncbi:PaaI family thioesterase [Desertimonas flava]|uniref:PaaI family thioesterase n=1 Tax=Desertimonas flava TaxID=2064846 RepID=UPI0013C44A9E|nr:PaaI family thioesterase [Desertimonas flava]